MNNDDILSGITSFMNYELALEQRFSDSLKNQLLNFKDIKAKNESTKKNNRDGFFKRIWVGTVVTRVTGMTKVNIPLNIPL